MAFAKMHGLGNDYVYVDGFAQSLDGLDAPALARAISDRHRGVGSDGLILVAPPTVPADVRMEMFNADGSRGEMCGNGIRCVAKYALDHGLVPAKPGASQSIRVQTDRGVLTLDCRRESGRVTQVRVDMGRPILDPREIPTRLGTTRCVAEGLEVGGRPWSITCVSMGNPHAVLFVDDVAAIDLERLGPQFEHHAAFPKRVNSHVAMAISRREVRMRTWERGAGLTQACGTGACAVLVAGVLEGRLDRRAIVHLPGGDLDVEWPADDAPVFQTGPAVEVFSGVWPDA
ncbi:MAG: diaminopimelate epimerase [Phycisphaerae bacterium]|nr:diaminopimelate epimerase [Phycisphaerae bacterium]